MYTWVKWATAPKWIENIRGEHFFPPPKLFVPLNIFFDALGDLFLFLFFLTEMVRFILKKAELDSTKRKDTYSGKKYKCIAWKARSKFFFEEETETKNT